MVKPKEKQATSEKTLERKGLQKLLEELNVDKEDLVFAGKVYDLLRNKNVARIKIGVPRDLHSYEIFLMRRLSNELISEMLRENGFNVHNYGGGMNFPVKIMGKPEYFLSFYQPESWI